MGNYSVKEIFYTLQGEAARAGRPAVFLRFSGCNLWNGREEDRSSAICQFCDTDFVGTNGTLGGKYQASELAKIVDSLWPQQYTKASKYVVCTGGEPLLQLDDELIEQLHIHGFEVAIETNGTIEVPSTVDWICMSPKPNSKIIVNRGDELKFIYPQENFQPEMFEQLDFEHFYIQPMDNEDKMQNTQKAIAFCLANPMWKLSLQTHKDIGIR
ncbi:MAG TPA: 7-carboxy-7-deazaguanine synthase [Saprospiraceae bacterium]|nr:7-carboxy-7-deazaguanine synthase [Saprospiraceae bacterium]